MYEGIMFGMKHAVDMLEKVFGTRVFLFFCVVPVVSSGFGDMSLVLLSFLMAQILSRSWERVRSFWSRTATWMRRK